MNLPNASQSFRQRNPAIFTRERRKRTTQPELVAANGMNKWEREFSWILEDRKRQGGIYGYKFEPVALILAHRTTYTPDFVIWGLSCPNWVEFIEVKGFKRDDAIVK